MSEFLKELFQGAESGFLTLTQLIEGSSAHIEQVAHDQIDLVDDFIERRRVTCYYNIGLTRSRLDAGRRGAKDDILGVSCLWMDIDLPKESSKKSYPPLEHIKSTLAAMPLKYTALVHTGGGLHVYWFLNELKTFADRAEAEAFEASYSKPWLNLFKVKLAEHGQYAIDAVHDVSRMMRIPLSWHKNGRQCVVEEADYSLRYGLEDFEPFLEAVNVETLLPTKFLPKFTRVADGKLNMRRLDGLIRNSSAFKKVWERKNTLDDNDSSVDASLARHAVDAGWSDDEIADLLFVFWDKWNPDRLAKVFRHEPAPYGNYVGRVISFVRGEAAKSPRSVRFGPPDENNPPDLDDPISGEPTLPEEPKKSADESRLESLKKLSSIFKLPVARWIQVGKDNPLYTLVLADGLAIRIGGEAAVVDAPTTFVRRLYSYFPLLQLEPFTKAAWANALYGLGTIVEVIDAPEMKLSEIALAGITHYLEQMSYVGEKTRDRGLQQNKAYFDGTKIHINLADLMKFLNLHGGGHKWTNVEMVSALSALGFERETLNYTIKEGRRSSKSYWSKSADQFMDVIGCPSSKMSSE